MTSKKRQGAKGGAKQRSQAATGRARAAPVTEAGAGRDTPTDLYSLRQLSGLLGVDRNRLAERVRDIESFPGPNRSRLYSLEAVEEALADDPDPDIKEARLRKLRAEAGLAELKLKRELGEVVDYRGVRGDLLTLFRELNTCFTVTVPQRLAPRLRVATSTREAEEMLRVELEGALQEFRTEHTQYLEN